MQRAVHHRLRQGDDVIGFKLGYTSTVMREAMGIDEPNFAPLTRSMVRRSPTEISGLIQPKVEPEIGVVLDPSGGIDRLVFTAEVVDSVWRDYRFTWAHNTADGSSAAFGILGAEVAGELDSYRVRMHSSAGEESGARIADTRPDIAGSLAWLARQDTPRPLQQGDVILTGGLASPIDLPAGGWIEVEFEGPKSATTIRVRRSVDG